MEINNSCYRNITDEQKIVTKRTISCMIALWLARTFSLLKDALVSRFLGTGLASDSLIFIQKTTPTIKKIIGQGVFLQILTPVYYEEIIKNRTSKESKELIGSIITAVSLIMIATSLILWILYNFAPTLFLKKAPNLELAIKIVPHFLIYSVLTCIAGSCFGIVNLGGLFFIPTTVPMFYNICLIPILIIFRFHNPEMIVMTCARITIVSAIIQFLIMAYCMIKIGVIPNLVFNLKKIFFTIKEKLGKTGLYALISASLIEFRRIIHWIAFIIAGVGSVSYAGYSKVIMRLPILLCFGVAIASIVSFTKTYSDNRKEDLYSTFKHCVRQTYYIIIPTMIFIAFANKEIITVLFEGYKFTKASVVETSYLTLYFIIETPFVCNISILHPILYSLKKAKQVIIADVIAISIKCILIITLVYIIPKARIAIAISMVSTTIIYFFILRYILKQECPECYKESKFFKTVIECLIASIIAISVLYIVDKYIFGNIQIIEEIIKTFSSYITSNDLIAHIIKKLFGAGTVIIKALAYIFLYIITCSLLKLNEQKKIFKMIFKK